MWSKPSADSSNKDSKSYKFGDFSRGLISSVKSKIETSTQTKSPTPAASIPQDSKEVRLEPRGLDSKEVRLETSDPMDSSTKSVITLGYKFGDISRGILSAAKSVVSSPQSADEKATEGSGSKKYRFGDYTKYTLNLVRKKWDAVVLGNPYLTLGRIMGYLTDTTGGTYAMLKGLTSSSDINEDYKVQNSSLFENIKLFGQLRRDADDLYASIDIRERENIESLPLINMLAGDNRAQFQQLNMQGNSLESIEELYEVANTAKISFDKEIVAIGMQLGLHVLDHHGHGGPLQKGVMLAGLKGQERAIQKATNEYGDVQPGPAIGWLFDIVRAAIICSTIDEIVECFKLISQVSNFRIIRLKNRFRSPTPAGYRDINMNISIDLGNGIRHICELQIHLKDVKEFGLLRNSHAIYEYFRVFFAGGQEEAIASRIDYILSFPSFLDADANVSSLIETQCSLEDMKTMRRLFESIGELDIAIAIEVKILESSIAQFGTQALEVADKYLVMAKMVNAAGEVSLVGLNTFYEDCYERAESIYRAASEKVKLVDCLLDRIIQLNTNILYKLDTKRDVAHETSKQLCLDKLTEAKALLESEPSSSQNCKADLVDIMCKLKFGERPDIENALEMVTKLAEELEERFPSLGDLISATFLYRAKILTRLVISPKEREESSFDDKEATVAKLQLAKDAFDVAEAKATKFFGKESPQVANILYDRFTDEFDVVVRLMGADMKKLMLGEGENNLAAVLLGWKTSAVLADFIQSSDHAARVMQVVHRESFMGRCQCLLYKSRMQAVQQDFDGATASRSESRRAMIAYFQEKPSVLRGIPGAIEPKQMTKELKKMFGALTKNVGNLLALRHQHGGLIQLATTLRVCAAHYHDYEHQSVFFKLYAEFAQHFNVSSRAISNAIEATGSNLRKAQRSLSVLIQKSHPLFALVAADDSDKLRLYLHDHDDSGKVITEAYVVARHSGDHVSPLQYAAWFNKIECFKVLFSHANFNDVVEFALSGSLAAMDPDMASFVVEHAAVNLHCGYPTVFLSSWSAGSADCFQRMVALMDRSGQPMDRAAYSSLVKLTPYIVTDSDEAEAMTECLTSFIPEPSGEPSADDDGPEATLTPSEISQRLNDLVMHVATWQAGASVGSATATSTAQSPTATAPAPPVELEPWMGEHRLESLRDLLAARGVASMAELLQLPQAEIDGLAENLKPIEKKRFQRALLQQFNKGSPADTDTAGTASSGTSSSSSSSTSYFSSSPSLNVFAGDTSAVEGLLSSTVFPYVLQVVKEQGVAIRRHASCATDIEASDKVNPIVGELAFDRVVEAQEIAGWRNRCFFRVEGGWVSLLDEQGNETLRVLKKQAPVRTATLLRVVREQGVVVRQGLASTSSVAFVAPRGVILEAVGSPVRTTGAEGESLLSLRLANGTGWIDLTKSQEVVSAVDAVQGEDFSKAIGVAASGAGIRGADCAAAVTEALINLPPPDAAAFALLSAMNSASSVRSFEFVDKAAVASLLGEGVTLYRVVHSEPVPVCRGLDPTSEELYSLSKGVIVETVGEPMLSGQHPQHSCVCLRGDGGCVSVQGVGGPEEVFLEAM